MEQWFRSDLYQQLIVAVNQRDVPRQRLIQDEALARTEGAEQAFWYLVRAGNKAAWAGMVIDGCWEDIAIAVHTAPDHPNIRRIAVATAIAFVLRTEQVWRLKPYIPQLREALRDSPDQALLQYNLGQLQLRRGKWGTALSTLNQALDGMAGWSPERMAANRGRLFIGHAQRARAAVACGQFELARRSIEAAAEVARDRVTSPFEYMALAVAEAELALAQERFGDARHALQMGLMRDTTGEWLRSSGSGRAQAELVAGRIARAEGNMEAFFQFCEKALAIAAQRDLCLTEARIRAVMAGADR